MKIIECPRDAMQGLKEFIPTELKAAYINALLKVGFDTMDFGSFVSPKVTPQMKDTAEVLEKLELEGSRSKLLAIVASVSGARQAVVYPQITYLGFPLSVSETFQLRNTNKTIAQAMQSVEEMQELCRQHNKTQVVYISMGFGNPYGDAYDEDIVEEFVYRLDALGVKIISLSDTIGVSNPDNIKPLFERIIPKFPHIEFGAHFHSNPRTAVEKVDAAYQAGCRRFDGAIGGYGGCPMAKDELTGNIATEKIIEYLTLKKIPSGLDLEAFAQAMQMTDRVFPANYHTVIS